MGVEIHVPDLQGTLIVTPQHFDISNLQVVFNDMANHFLQSRDIAAREDVLVDPAVVGPALLSRDAMNQCHAVIGQVAGNVFKVQAQIFLADVFEHPHRNDVVPLPIAQFTIVHQQDLGHVLQVFFFNRVLH